jgi:hypothetical protein
MVEPPLELLRSGHRKPVLTKFADGDKAPRACSPAPSAALPTVDILRVVHSSLDAVGLPRDRELIGGEAEGARGGFRSGLRPPCKESRPWRVRGIVHFLDRVCINRECARGFILLTEHLPSLRWPRENASSGHDNLDHEGWGALEGTSRSGVANFAAATGNRAARGVPNCVDYKLDLDRDPHGRRRNAIGARNRLPGGSKECRAIFCFARRK